MIPPRLFQEKGVVAKGVFFLPEKAIYGLRRSPRLWSETRDATLTSLRIEGERNHKKMVFQLRPLESEPNLWKLQNANGSEDENIYGLLMTYVDDLLLAAPPTLLQALKEKIQSIWTTSTPEVTEVPTRFLGTEISKFMDPKTQRSLDHDSKILHPRLGLRRRSEIPIARDQALMEPEESPSIEEVRFARKCVGETLWLATRTRPDIAFAVARLGSNVTKAPVMVAQATHQPKGYLKKTCEEGILFDVDPDQ